MQRINLYSHNLDYEGKVENLIIYFDDDGIIKMIKSKSILSEGYFGRDLFSPKAFYNFIGHRGIEGKNYYFTIGYNPDLSIAYHYEDIAEKLLNYIRDNDGRIITCEEIFIKDRKVTAESITKYEYHNDKIIVIKNDEKKIIKCEDHYKTFENNYFSPYSGLNIKTLEPIKFDNGKVVQIVREQSNPNQFCKKYHSKITINIDYINGYDKFEVNINNLVSCNFESINYNSFKIKIRQYGSRSFTTITNISKTIFGLENVDKFMSKIINFSDIIFNIFDNYYYDSKMTEVIELNSYDTRYIVDHNNEPINFSFDFHRIEDYNKWFGYASERINKSSIFDKYNYFNNNSTDINNYSQYYNQKEKPKKKSSSSKKFISIQEKIIRNINISKAIDWSELGLKPIEIDSDLSYIDEIIKKLYDIDDKEIQTKLIIALNDNVLWKSIGTKDYHLYYRPINYNYATKPTKVLDDTRHIKSKFKNNKYFKDMILSSTKKEAINIIYKESFGDIDLDIARDLYDEFIASLDDKGREKLLNFKFQRERINRSKTNKRKKKKVKKPNKKTKISISNDKSDFTSIIDDEELFGNDPEWNLDLKEGVEDDISDIYVNDIYYSSSKEYYFNAKEYINQLNEKIMRGRV